jgi:hypothetical protein
MQRQPQQRQNGLVDLVPINLHGLSLSRKAVAQDTTSSTRVNAKWPPCKPGGYDRHAGALVELAQQMEQQGPARGAEWQVSQLVE